MNDRDCESCKKFSRGDPYESEDYCEVKRTWVDPQEREDCKMHEFTLWSATKYKDGTPIMTEPNADTNSPYPESILKPESNQLDSLEQRVDELSEEYDAVLKILGDTLEQHKERITNNEGNIDAISSEVEVLERNIDAISSEVEDLQREVLAIYKYLDARIRKLSHNVFFDDCKLIEEFTHKGTDFCGNCAHAKLKDDLCRCEYIKGFVDPDSASCSHFEPPF